MLCTLSRVPRARRPTRSRLSSLATADRSVSASLPLSANTVAYKGKLWSAEEVATLQSILNEHSAIIPSGTYNSRNDDTAPTFWKGVADRLGTRTAAQCYSRYRRSITSIRTPALTVTSTTGTRGLLWSEAENSQLLEAVRVHGTDWNAVSSAMGNDRTPYQCCNRYHAMRYTMKYQSGPWSDAETGKLARILFKAMPQLLTPTPPTTHTERFDKSFWDAVSSEMRARSGRSCWNRWTWALRKDINRLAFTDEEKALLRQSVKEMGTTWLGMVNRFPGRSHRQLLNCYWTMNRRE
jgi:hypothetical protein